MLTRHDEQHYRDIINELENDKEDLRDMMVAFGHENTELHRQKRLYKSICICVVVGVILRMFV